MSKLTLVRGFYRLFASIAIGMSIADYVVHKASYLPLVTAGLFSCALVLSIILDRDQPRR